MLRDGDFSNAALRHASLSACDLRRTDFYQAQLDGASLQGSLATDAAFCECSLTGLRARNLRAERSQWTAAQAHQADFSGADLRESVWDYAQARACNFQDSNHQWARHHAFAAPGADWRGAKRQQVQGTDIDLYEAERWQPPSAAELA
ncbi:MAG: pentapeptide repeat-containing protein [Planctomycetota bacterium]